MRRRQLTFLEFFAGGGMARLGLGRGWRCLFANDVDPMKRDAYGANFGLDDHRFGDVHALGLEDLPIERADLAWASSPCQDLSLAGARSGLKGERSGAFFGFWRLIEALGDVGRAPRIVVIENVAGLLTSNGGADFAEVATLLAARGYLVSALVLNADAFLPQSRPRLFIVGMKDAAGGVLTRLRPAADAAAPPSLLGAVDNLPQKAKQSWRWIAARPERRRNLALIDILDDAAPFDPVRATKARLAAMAPRQRAVIDALAADGGRCAGAAFRRIRIEGGQKRARIEARFDGLAGCIRTPAGGSSRQIIFDIENGKVQSRLMSPREAARAMGLGEDYKLPQRATNALKLVGDGVAPPVVRWLAENVLEAALAGAQKAA